MKKKLCVLSLLFCLALPCFARTEVGNVSKAKTPITPIQEQQMTLGAVQMYVKLGCTQADVVSALGSPNIITKDADGKDTWIYDKVATISSYNNSGFGVTAGGGVGGIGGSVIGGGLLGVGYKKNKGVAATNQKTLTVVIKFNRSDKVESFTYHMSSF